MDEEKMTSVKKQLDEIARANRKSKKYEDLEQLDRIEYFLLNEHINENHRLLIFNSISGFIHIGFMFIVLAILMWVHLNSSTLLGLTSEFLFILKYAIGVIIVIDVFNLVSKFFKKRSLRKRFFENEKP